MAAQVRPASLPTIGIQDCLVLIAFLSLVLVQMQNFAQDPGVGWHLSTGQHVFSTGEIPRVDSFLASSSPRPWVADQWLGSTFLYALFKSGSWPMVYASLTLIYLLTYAAILYGVLARLSGSYIAASLAAIYAFKIGQLHFIMRPVMLSFPLFAAVTGFVYVLYHALKSASGAQAATSFRYAAVGLPLIFALWSNVHPSFVLGLGLLGLLPLSVL
ncbi:MAG: hypothetical protein GX589_08180, partial [Deltaproteobacteria bacterium]|nr:hypothetical protein [Deltaproteobacteria bacterium]